MKILLRLQVWGLVLVNLGLGGRDVLDDLASRAEKALARVLFADRIRDGIRLRRIVVERRI